jgi:hypothetical protein
MDGANVDVANVTTINGETALVAAAPAAAVYDLLYIASTGYAKAQANAAATTPCVVMAIEADNAGTRKVLKRGYVKNAAWAWTKGQMLYVSPTTAGGITATLPATAGQQVQIIGYAESANTIYFNPQYVVVEV